MGGSEERVEGKSRGGRMEARLDGWRGEGGSRGEGGRKAQEEGTRGRKEVILVT